MTVRKEEYGLTPQGEQAYLYTIETGLLKAQITNFGAALVSLCFPDREGKVTDVVLGYSSLHGYFDNPACMGCVIAPNANRITGAEFTINGTTYHIDRNEGENNLHSHLSKGAHKRLWQEKHIGENGISFELYMADGELGFPGNRIIDVTYHIEDEQSLVIDYEIFSDRDTIFNPTNHSYFNLGGHDSGSILSHLLQLKSSYYTPVTIGTIPTGKIEKVNDTPMDFRQLKTVGRDLDISSPYLRLTQGYDHNFCIDSYDGKLRHFATLKHPTNGIAMNGYTTQPGVQLYGGNYLGSDEGKDGAVYHGMDGLCLETQFYPNAINEENFLSPLVEANKWYTYTTEYYLYIDEN